MNDILTPSPPIPAAADHRMSLGVVQDFREENWVSMDFVAEMLLQQYNSTFADEVEARPILARFRRIATAPVAMRNNPRALNADRLLNRYWGYPRYLRRHLPECARYHVVDHSYAQLTLELPADRTGVYLHDIDPFRCLVTPERAPASRLVRRLMRRVLRGVQRAAVVFYATAAARDEIVQHQLVDPQRLVWAPLGTAREYHYAPESPAISDFTGLPDDTPFLLHVGSCVPRKRIDIVLETFARLRSAHPNLHLLKIGGTWSKEHEAIIDRHQLRSAIVHRLEVARVDVARAYRRAAVVLFPSEREGFGLPVIEALACGAIVVASDIPPLLEVGGNAVDFCPLPDVDCYVATIDRVLRRPETAPSLATRLAQAGQFSWKRHAAIILDAYRKLPV
jgi:glycosyltransferase involved in cell wall biosynthesis